MRIRRIAENESLKGIVNRIGDPDWDLILIGDGSGVGREDFCGWACVAVIRPGNVRRMFLGNSNYADGHFAEIVPYLQALTWYFREHVHTPADRTRVHRVHILTDCEAVINVAEWCRPPRGNPVWWHVFRALEDQGLALHWHWIKRRKLKLSKLVDDVSRKCREDLKLDRPLLEERYQGGMRRIELCNV